ncbi:hypothetical protein Bb109J_c1464 [Bdellovibrio bacteriovorus]|uniref:hypothetical protein n=1 Tax=Bdellovibrio bacteriovorus TaxID=959 RepID=UPI00045BE609|nr:hypothetical protein [Bdellovibrio bacteriovorus]AHZ84160.1 hypothetical protein EP01_04280 [Bdellovibrio bacteriovorus]BEV68044.1 hypothetical protein Bb109J_c1464 [Bdellovibrio bacteriovorus]
MRNLLSVLVILLLLTTVDSLAVPVNIADKTQQLVDQFYAAKDLWVSILGNPPRPLPPEEYPPDSPNNPGNPPPNRPPNCPPDGGGGGGGFPGRCVEAVCKQLSRFECDDKDDMYEVTRACRNVSGPCVTSLCSRMSRFSCDEKVEVFEVAGLCRGLVDISCIDYVCSRLSRFDCDEMSELRQVAQQCR